MVVSQTLSDTLPLTPRITDPRVVRRLRAESLVRARAATLREFQGHLYAQVPEGKRAWEEFTLPFICRVRGCRDYGKDFEEMDALEAHFQTNAH
jgi:hypothetical protein